MPAPTIPSVIDRLRMKEQECLDKIRALKNEAHYFEAQAEAYRQAWQMLQDEETAKQNMNASVQPASTK